MIQDRITGIRIKGLRCLEDVHLKPRGLTVLIGENGSGKSSLVEACEILRKAGDSSNIVADLISFHFGLTGLLRIGARRLELGISTRGDNDILNYSFALAKNGDLTVIEEEQLTSTPIGTEKSEIIFERTPSAVRILSEKNGVYENGHTPQPGELLLTAFGLRPPHPALDRVSKVLKGIDVHLPFEVTAGWAAHELQHQSTIRKTATLLDSTRLERFGLNLANAYHKLRNGKSEEHFQDTLDYIRVGLGQHITSVTSLVDDDGGRHTLQLEYKGVGKKIRASNLSDGTLAYLAFVAMYRLGENRSMLVMDEPETHLHPRLLMRVLDFFEQMAVDYPVIISTHSDRLLDGLSDPAKAAVLCNVNDKLRTRLLKPNRDELSRWLEKYRGLGELRTDGFEQLVMTTEEP